MFDGEGVHRFVGEGFLHPAYRRVPLQDAASRRCRARYHRAGRSAFLSTPTLGLTPSTKPTSASPPTTSAMACGAKHPELAQEFEGEVLQGVLAIQIPPQKEALGREAVVGPAAGILKSGAILSPVAAARRGPSPRALDADGRAAYLSLRGTRGSP